MSVYLDGATLSALLFSNLNSRGSKYGFLIGEKIEHTEDSISDSQIRTYDVNSYIYVSSYSPWPSQICIYSRDGHFGNEWMKHLFAKTEQTLVGWYSFRHNTTARPSLREITLHNNLSTSEHFAGQPKDFLFFLCTSSFSSNMSTHTFTHGFMHNIDGSFVSVPMTVMNLGDTTRREYRRRSNAALSHNKTVLESLHTIRKGFLESSGEMEQITKMNHLATSVNKSLMSVHNKVFESEAALGLLETDVDILRQRIEHIEQEETRTAQMDAEIKIQEREEEIRKQEEEERKHPEKLLINLEISSVDIPADAFSFVPDLHHSNSFPVEISLIDDHIENFQVIEPSPSISIEYVFVNNNDKHTSSTSEDVSALTHNKHTGHEQNNINRMKVTSCEKKKPQTAKDKVSEAFSFLDEELKLKSRVGNQRQQSAYTHACKSEVTARKHNETCDINLVSSTHKSSKNVEMTDVSNTFNVESKVMQNRGLVKDNADIVNVDPTGGDVMIQQSCDLK